MLDLSPILLLSSTVIFLIVLARLNSCLYTPLLKHIDERTESIKKDLQNAQSNVSNVDEMYEKASNIIADAKKEASLIRQNAYSEAKIIGDNKITEFKTQLDTKYNIFVNDLNSQTQSLKLSLTEQLPIFKQQLSAKISSI
jgi:F-type H+-transporting ATPase subunit b